MPPAVESLAYAGKTPWHNLGERMTDAERRDMSAAMTKAGLNWTVATVPLSYDWGGINGQAAKDSKAVIRTDIGRFLSTVGKDYTPAQNHESLSLLEPLVDMGCTIEVMGALNGGRTVFGLLRMPNASIDVAGNGDDVNGYALLRNAHDGSSALAVDLTPVRVVCANTLALAAKMAHSTAVRLRHTTKVADRIADAKLVVEKMGEAFAQTGDTFAQLAQRKMGPAEVAAYIEAVITGPVDKAGNVSQTILDRRDTIAQLTFTGKGNAVYRDGEATTAWAAYNAVTEYFDHYRRVEAKAASAKLAADESALFGGNARIKANALQIAAQLVAA